jgi:hypothetical protein
MMMVVATLSSACSDAPQPTPPANYAALPQVAVTATEFAIDAPDSLESGWTCFHLTNNGQALHAALLVKLGPDRTLDDFTRAYAAAWEAKASFASLGLVGGLVAPPPGGSTNATLFLEPGNYAWYCPMHWEGDVPHVFGHDMSRAFVVTEPREPPATALVPEPSVTITMVDYGYDLSAPLTAGQHLIRVANTGREGHEVILMQLATGKTIDDMRAWLEDPRTPPPVSRSLGGVVLEEAGAEEGYFEAELRSGEYVLFCTINAPDGRPHTDHGMIQQVRVE